MSETTPANVFVHSPRHPLENTVLQAQDPATDCNWVFEIVAFDGYAVARLICTYDAIDPAEASVEAEDNHTTVPWSVAKGIMLHDQVDAIKNPVEDGPEDEERSIIERFKRSLPEN